MVTLESSASAAPVDISNVAAAAEIVAAPMGRPLPEIYSNAIVASDGANLSGFLTAGKPAPGSAYIILQYAPPS
jgi:hypothetical protein